MIDWFTNLLLAHRLVPALRPALGKASADIFTLYRGAYGALTQVAVFLHRIGAEAWSSRRSRRSTRSSMNPSSFGSSRSAGYRT